MHRFLHLGDLHLGPNDRNDDRIAALDQVISEGLAQPLAAWLWPGDLFHQRSRPEDRNVLKERLKRMANHAPVVLAYGNHDIPGDLDIFADLNAVHPIRVVGRPEVIDLRTATGANAAIFVLPYPTRAGLVAAGVASDNLVDAARGALDIIFMDAAAKLANARKAGMLTLMIGHVNVAGSIVSSGQPNIGREIEIDQALLDRLGPIYKGLNHIHKGQEICGAVYPGSMCRLDWGEIERKQYLTIDVDDDADLRPGILEHPIDVAPMYHVEGEMTRDAEGVVRFPWDLVLRQGEQHPGFPDSWEGAEVRVRYRFNAAEKSVLNDVIVRETFKGAKRLELDPIAEHTRAVREPEVVAAQTLEEKLRAIAKGAGVAWTPAVDDKLALLQSAPDGATFLTTIESSLSGAAASLINLSEEQDAAPDNSRQEVLL